MAEAKDQWTSFQTARLLVKPLSLDPSIVQDLYEIRSHESVYKWSVHPPFTALAEAEKWISSKMDFPRAYGYSIELLDEADASSSKKTTDGTQPQSQSAATKIIGTMGIVNSNEIGYQFHPSTWGRGYATEAITGLVKHIYSNEALAHVDVLQAWVSPENEASKRVLQKCAFRKDEEREVVDIKANYEPAQLGFEELEQLKHAVKDMNIDTREGQFERPPPVPKKYKLEVYVITRADVEEQEYVVV